MSENYANPEISNIYSKTKSFELSHDDLRQSFLNVLDSEIQTGVDRSNDARGMSQQLNWHSAVLGNLCHDNSSGLDAELFVRSLAEFVTRLKNPNTALCGTICHLVMAEIKKIVPNIDYINTVHLDYLEKYLNESIDSSNVILMQDIETFSLDKFYDLIFIDFEIFSHDLSLVDNLWAKVAPNGLMCLWNVNDFHKVYQRGTGHAWTQYLMSLTEREDMYTFHIPILTGFTLVIKR